MVGVRGHRPRIPTKPTSLDHRPRQRRAEESEERERGVVRRDISGGIDQLVAGEKEELARIDGDGALVAEPVLSHSDRAGLSRGRHDRDDRSRVGPVRIDQIGRPGLGHVSHIRKLDHEPPRKTGSRLVVKGVDDELIGERVLGKERFQRLGVCAGTEIGIAGDEIDLGVLIHRGCGCHVEFRGETTVVVEQTRHPAVGIRHKDHLAAEHFDPADGFAQPVEALDGTADPRARGRDDSRISETGGGAQGWSERVHHRGSISCGGH